MFTQIPMHAECVYIHMYSCRERAKKCEGLYIYALYLDWYKKDLICSVHYLR